MKVGDLVKSIHGKVGVIMDIDPLRRSVRKHTPEFKKDEAPIEIVVMLDNGLMWHTAPAGWDVISETR